MNLESNADALPFRHDPSVGYQCAVIEANEILKCDNRAISQYQLSVIMAQIRKVKS